MQFNSACNLQNKKKFGTYMDTLFNVNIKKSAIYVFTYKFFSKTFKKI